jgi:hypothetical protein
MSAASAIPKLAAGAALAAAAYCGLILYAQPRLLYLARTYEAYGMRREYDSAVRRFEQRTGRRVVRRTRPQPLLFRA